MRGARRERRPLPRIDRALGAIVVAGALAAPAAARAQDGGNKALAEALFRDGRDLLAAGKTSEACAKFAMSHRVEPKVGTLLNLASCHEAEGKTATAWAEFTEAIVQASRANQQEREEFARKRATDLAGQLSRVTISAGDTDQLTVKINGVLLDRAVLGTPIPLDPGEHTVVVSAPGKSAWKKSVVVPKGPAVTEIAVPPLVREGDGVAVAAAGTGRPPSTASGAPRVPDAAELEEAAAQRTGAWIAFGVGALGAGFGTFFGIRALSLNSDARDACNAPASSPGCNDAGTRFQDDAETSAHASTVAFGVALVAVGVGVYLLVRSGAAPSARPPSAPAHARRAVSAPGFSW